MLELFLKHAKYINLQLFMEKLIFKSIPYKASRYGAIMSFIIRLMLIEPQLAQIGHTEKNHQNIATNQVE